MNTSAPIVAIVGRANVGKSSLFNAVLNKRRAITADEPGTTRDSLMAKVEWADKQFWLCDTAGLKPAEDEFELSIQAQITEAVASANCIAVVVEASVPITEQDRRVAKLALKSRKPVVLIVNKIDKNRKVNLDEYRRLGITDIIAVSATQKTGLEQLLDKLAQVLPAGQIKEDDNRLKIAILGRPNVGKSSLFNTLAKKQQAIISSRAGTTRDINRLSLRYKSRELEIMDTAGIRRSGKIEQGVERFSVLRSLSAIEESDIGLLIMDAGEMNVQLDQKIAGLIKDAGRGLILVVSKWDTLDKEEANPGIVARRVADDFAFVPWAPLVFVSSITGQNVTKIFELALEIDAAREQKLKTAELNNWLGEVTREHPPAGLKNRSPRLNYMVQEDDQLFPNFKIFGAHTKFLHWSYKRYLERKFRESWNYAGIPIKFWFIEKH